MLIMNEVILKVVGHDQIEMNHCECVEKVNNIVHSMNNRCVSRRDRFIIFQRIVDMNVFEKISSLRETCKENSKQTTKK